MDLVSEVLREVVVAFEDHREVVDFVGHLEEEVMIPLAFFFAANVLILHTYQK